MEPFQTLSADHDNFLKYSLHCEIVRGETQLFIFNVLQNFLNTVSITLFTMSELTIHLLARFPDFFSLKQSLLRALMSKVNFP